MNGETVGYTILTMILATVFIGFLFIEVPLYFYRRRLRSVKHEGTFPEPEEE